MLQKDGGPLKFLTWDPEQQEHENLGLRHHLAGPAWQSVHTWV